MSKCRVEGPVFAILDLIGGLVTSLILDISRDLSNTWSTFIHALVKEYFVWRNTRSILRLKRQWTGVVDSPQALVHQRIHCSVYSPFIEITKLKHLDMCMCFILLKYTINYHSDGVDRMIWKMATSNETVQTPAPATHLSVTCLEWKKHHTQNMLSHTELVKSYRHYMQVIIHYCCERLTMAKLKSPCLS